MKRLKYIIITLVLFILTNNVYAFNTNIKVYDYAQKLTTKEEIKLRKDINLFIANHNIDMAVVLVKHHEKKDTITYGNEFYNINGFGIGNTKDGILCIIDFTDQQENIELLSFGNTQKIYNDGTAKKIVEYINKRIKKGYYNAVDTFITKSNYYANIKLNKKNVNSSVVRALKLMLISLIISVLYIIYLLLKNNLSNKKNINKIYVVKDSFVINKKTEKFTTTKTKPMKLKK